MVAIIVKDAGLIGVVDQNVLVLYQIKFHLKIREKKIIMRNNFFIQEFLKSLIHSDIISCHPNRDEIISEDEITNLVIDLETCKSLEEFLDKN